MAANQHTFQIGIRKADAKDVFNVFIHEFGLYRYEWKRKDLENMHEWIGKLLKGEEAEYFTPPCVQMVFYVPESAQPERQGVNPKNL